MQGRSTPGTGTLDSHTGLRAPNHLLLTAAVKGDPYKSKNVTHSVRQRYTQTSTAILAKACKAHSCIYTHTQVDKLCLSPSKHTHAHMQRITENLNAQPSPACYSSAQPSMPTTTITTTLNHVPVQSQNALGHPLHLQLPGLTQSANPWNEHEERSEEATNQYIVIASAEVKGQS